MVDSWGELPEPRREPDAVSATRDARRERYSGPWRMCGTACDGSRRDYRGEERFVAAYWWYIIIAFGLLAVIINGALALSRRNKPMVALVRAAAGVVSLVAVTGVIVVKAGRIHAHPKFQPSEIFIAAGVFIFAVLFLPTYFERNFQGEAEAKAKPTLQQRAARPVNATVRLRDKSSDEWVN